MSLHLSVALWRVCSVLVVVVPKVIDLVCEWQLFFLLQVAVPNNLADISQLLKESGDNQEVLQNLKIASMAMLEKLQVERGTKGRNVVHMPNGSNDTRGLDMYVAAWHVSVHVRIFVFAFVVVLGVRFNCRSCHALFAQEKLFAGTSIRVVAVKRVQQSNCRASYLLLTAHPGRSTEAFQTPALG